MQRDKLLSATRRSGAAVSGAVEDIRQEAKNDMTILQEIVNLESTPRECETCDIVHARDGGEAEGSANMLFRQPQSWTPEVDRMSTRCWRAVHPQVLVAEPHLQTLAEPTHRRPAHAQDIQLVAEPHSQTALCLPLPLRPPAPQPRLRGWVQVEVIRRKQALRHMWVVWPRRTRG